MKGDRILLIEDEETQSKPFQQLLEFHEYIVESATNDTAGLDLLIRFDPMLVVVDLLLVANEVAEDGFEVVRMLRGASATVGILVWTSQYLDARDEIRVLRAGADDYVRKESEVGVIEARINALLRRVRHTRALAERLATDSG